MKNALDDALLLQGVEQLITQDDDLRAIVARHGPPPLWAREPGFPTLLQIILEQQVSLASARATFDRLCAIANPLTPARFLELTDQDLKNVGFSRQKTAYGRGLANALIERRIDLDRLQHLDDHEVQRQLTSLRGIGAWTANIYLLMVLRRPDIWPMHDLALASAAQRVKRLAERPTPDQLQQMAEIWRPLRAIAARLLWHEYLSW